LFELYGVYKLTKIRNFEDNDSGDYKVIELVCENNIVCKKLDVNMLEKNTYLQRNLLLILITKQNIFGAILVFDTKKKG
jgi:hypothetical protein